MTQVAETSPTVIGAESRGGASAGARTPASAWSDVAALAKPGITRLVTLTSAIGFFLAWLDSGAAAGDLAIPAVGCLVGTALSAMGANALNQCWEQQRDAQMRRTAGRPIPSGRMPGRVALALASVWCGSGLVTLLSLCGWVPATVSAVTILTYVLVYTPLKPVTTLNTLVGAIPGALPPLIGFTSVPGVLGGSGDALAGMTGGLSLVLLMFIWQVPHFLAIAWMHQEDYARGGFRMLPLHDASGRLTSTTIVLWAVAFIPASLSPALFMRERFTYFYPSVAIVSGAAFVWMCVRLLRSRSRGDARKVFFASIIHLPLLLLTIVGDALLAEVL